MIKTDVDTEFLTIVGVLSTDRDFRELCAWGSAQLADNDDVS